MKYSLFILFFLLSGCIFDQNKTDSNSVQLTNFRSATELSYKTTNSDWIKIEDDPDDILVFKTEDDRKYQVSIDCSFNEYKKKRLYLLDSVNFSQLDLNCDAKIEGPITINTMPENVTSYELYTPYSLETFMFFPCQGLCFLFEVPKEISTLNRIDRDKEIEVMGEVCFDTGICQMYYRKEKSDYIFNTDSIDFNDKNFLYDFPSIKADEYNPYFDDVYLAQAYYLSEFANSSSYFSSNNQVFPLTINAKNFGIPQSIRSKNDGYFYSSFWQEKFGELFSPSYLLFQASTYSDFPDLRIRGKEAIEPQKAQLNPKFLRSSAEDEKDSITFEVFTGSEFNTTYYSLSIQNYQIFIARSYAIDKRITFDLPEKITHDENNDDVYFSIFNLLHVNGEFTNSINGNHKIRPRLSIQDSSYNDLLNTPQTESQ
ncbi:hypothetical protein A9R00_12340 [Oleispira antarctica]|uniref:Uncharacterized protein n=1 Tax=Oleispira antarctica TaxID=188908 RepID=A0A1Y5HIZ1_OLEAN|nr:hypothetical protein A9R00_12340 [Oleispira antarctica]